MLTHEDWVNGAWYKSLLGAPLPANPVRNTKRPNGWKSQPFGRLVSQRGLPQLAPTEIALISAHPLATPARMLAQHIVRALEIAR